MQYQRTLPRIILLTLVVSATWKADWAEAAVANAEDAYLKILNVYRNDDPPPDPNTRDRDGNGIVDRAHYRLFDALLANPAAPRHAEITAAYEANLAQVQRDNSGGVVCLFLPSLYGFTCDDFNRYAASLMTIAEPASVDILINELASRMHLTFDVNDYNLTMGQYLQGGMDLDGDTISNVQEFSSVCNDFDKYVQAAMDAALTPSTLPCCGDCPLTIVQHPAGASVYVHGTHSFVVAVDKVETTAHYQWYKDHDTVGTNAPELSLTDIQLADAGEYWCRVTDDTEEVVSDKALLVVVEHLSIALQPQGADLQPGGSYTLSIAITGGFGAIHYYWFKNEAAIGEDAPQLLLSGLQPENSGTYWCEISDDHERIESDHVQLNVVPRLEGEGINEGEDIFEGTIEGSSAEGETEGVHAEGEDIFEGAIEGSPAEGTIEGTVEGSIEGSPTEGEIEGMQSEGEGVIEGAVEGEIHEGEGQAEGTMEGFPEGMQEGEGAVEGIYEGEVVEGEGLGEGELTEGEAVEGEGLGEGELTEGELTEGELTEGELTEGELTEGEVVEGEVVEGEGIGEGAPTEGETQEGEGLGEGELTEGEMSEGEGLGEGELTEGETGEGEGENGIGCFNGDQNNPANWQSLGDLLLNFLTIIFLTLIRRLFQE